MSVVLYDQSNASVAELVDALVLGTSAFMAWGFESPRSHNTFSTRTALAVPSLRREMFSFRRVIGSPMRS